MTREVVQAMLRTEREALSCCVEQMALLQVSMAAHLRMVEELERSLGQPELPMAGPNGTHGTHGTNGTQRVGGAA